ncbi:MAG: hypothetical protein OHK0012_06470 [Synechococcales cyanobacterium]
MVSLLVERSTQSPRPWLTSPWLRLGIPLLLQMGILVTIPAPKAYTLATGTPILLQTVPVDPYDLLRGRYVTLDYRIAQPETLQKLSGWSSELYDQPYIYVTLTPGSQASDAWIPMAVSAQKPLSLAANQQVIRGQWLYGRLDFGLGQYFMPEDIGDPLEADLRRFPDEARAEVKVDRHGGSALVNVWVQDRRY